MDFNEQALNSREVMLRCKNGAETQPFGMLEINRDFILPDSYADIKRILSVSYSLAPSSGYVEGHKAFFGGELTCRVLFVSDEGSIHGVPFTLEYEESLTLGPADGIYSVTFMPTAEGVSARSVNPRKIGIKAKINPGIFVWEARDAGVRYPDSMTQADRDSFEEKSEVLPYFTVLRGSLNGVESGDDIEFEGIDGPIGEILACDIVFSGVTAQAREDAVAVSATANVTVVYIKDTEEGHTATDTKLSFRHHSFPLSCMVELDGAEEKDTCLASLYCEKLTARPAENAAGENRTAELDLTYGVQVLLGKERTVTVAKDLYSTRYESENTEGELRYSRPIGKKDYSYLCRNEGRFKEDGVVLGASSVCKSAVLVKGEDGLGKLKGGLWSTVIIMEEDGSVVSESMELPFSLDTDLVWKEDPEYLARVTYENTKATLKDGVLSVEAPMSASVLAWENPKEKAVFSTRATAELQSREAGSFTVYFPASGETVWDIAKKYRVPQSDLVIVGSEKGRGREARRALILPGKKKAYFSGVIS